MPDINSGPVVLHATAEAGQPQEEQIGWRVLDPDGSVVTAGPVIVLEAVAETGEDG